MKVKYLGHSAFLFTSPVGQKVLTDPYAAGRGISYGAIKEAADVVTVSHDHADHNNAKAVAGNPTVLVGKDFLAQGGKKRVKDIYFEAYPAHHDAAKKSENAIFCFTLDRTRVCHLGDLGHLLTEEELIHMGKDSINILLIPVGGTYTLGPAEASELIAMMKPNIVIPMHYKTPKLDFPIASVEEFTKGRQQVKNLNSSEADIINYKLPALTETWVFNPAL